MQILISVLHSCFEKYFGLAIQRRVAIPFNLKIRGQLLDKLEAASHPELHLESGSLPRASSDNAT
jgi:hypothetical protein